MELGPSSLEVLKNTFKGCRFAPLQNIFLSSILKSPPVRILMTQRDVIGRANKSARAFFSLVIKKSLPDSAFLFCLVYLNNSFMDVFSGQCRKKSQAVFANTCLVLLFLSISHSPTRACMLNLNTQHAHARISPLRPVFHLPFFPPFTHKPLKITPRFCNFSCCICIPLYGLS